MTWLSTGWTAAVSSAVSSLKMRGMQSPVVGVDQRPLRRVCMGLSFSFSVFVRFVWFSLAFAIETIPGREARLGSRVLRLLATREARPIRRGRQDTEDKAWRTRCRLAYRTARYYRANNTLPRRAGRCQ